MNRYWLRTFCLMAVFVAVFALWPQTTYAGGSFLDTLQQTQEGQAGEQPAAANETLQPPASEEPAAEPAPAPAPVQGVKFQLTAQSLEAWIQQIIQQIISRMGGCTGGRIIIIRFPCGTGTSQPPSTPAPTTPAPTTPTTTTQPTTPATTSSPEGIAGLKAEMASKYGINAVDGDGATWSQRQLEEANKVLATLPEVFRGNTKNIQRDSVFQSPNVLGYVRMGIPTVHLLNSSCVQGTFQGTLVHEMTHCWQANHRDLTSMWQSTFWANGRSPNPPSVSSYGNTQPVEDMAESVRSYYQAGARMKASQPDRYEFIRKYVMGGKEF